MPNFGLISTRFLSLAAHLVIIISLLWAREDNVKASLPVDYSDVEYEAKDISFIVALALTIGCITIELAGLFCGVTTFMQAICLLSTCLHSSVCIILTFFIWDVWDSDLYWIIFTMFAALPGLIETIAIIDIIGFEKLC